jgi:predicted small metal-binding protein
MFRVGCKDIGVEGCDFVAEGEKVGKVETKMLDHILDQHPHMISGLTGEQHRELETRIKAGMHALEPGGEAREVDKHALLRVSCADLGVEGCDFVAADKKVRKVEERLFDHIRDQHPEMIAGLTYEQHRDFEHRVKAAVRPD